MKIGQEIATARRGLNLTQEQLAEQMQVVRQTVSKWEAGLAVPETGKLVQLAIILGCSVDKLLGMETQATLQVKTGNGGYEIDWTEAYPILKQYQGEMDIQYYQEVFIAMMIEVEKKYKYTSEDGMLALKDIFYQGYLKHIGAKG